MRHKKRKFLINRNTSWKKATLVSLTKSLLIHQSIKTTKAKAVAVKPVVEKLITLAKDNTLAAKRHAYKILCEHKLVSYLFNDIGPRFNKRSGGYTRVLNLGQRRGDGANIALLELTEIKKKEVKKHKKSEDKQKDKITAGYPATAGSVTEETKTKTEIAEKEHNHPGEKKASKKFLGGIRKIFKKERDSL
ncbi:MAG: 50S ribosomal protein L17 [Candidatus Omnitrophota bacterium]